MGTADAETTLSKTLLLSVERKKEGGCFCRCRSAALRLLVASQGIMSPCELNICRYQFQIVGLLSMLLSVDAYR